MNYTMTKYIYTLLTFLLISTSSIFSQNDQGYLEIKGSAKVDRSPLLGANMEVYKDGALEKSYPSDSKGRFSFSISLNAQYEIVIVKQGYYSKKLSFNTQMPSDEMGIWNYKFVVTMIPKIEGFDASLLDKPIGIIMYVDKVGEFDYDEGYTFNMLKKLESLMKEYEKAKKKEFERIINKADVAFENKDYEGAIALYDKAIDLDPYDPYPDDQIYVIDRILAEDNNAQKNYDKNISDADKYFRKDDLVSAKKYYKKALNYIEKDYPKDQIALIDNKFDNKDALAAELAAKEKAYIAAIAAGDKSFTAKQYESALSKYTEATNIKPVEQYPKDKISELNILIAQLLNNQQDKEAIEKAYNNAITMADAKLSSKDYISALSNYEKASQIKPAETYPKTKITEINNILAANKSIDGKYNGFITVADKAFTDKEYESAKKYYQQALTIKAQEDYPKSKIKEIDILLLQIAQQLKKDVDGNYLRLIAAADVSFNKKEYDVAKSKYKSALSLKSNESYPKQKILEIDNILAELANNKNAYDIAIARADNNFNSDNWPEAKVDYQLALSIFPKEQYPQTRLNEIENKLLSLKNADDQKKAREKAYNDAIIKGNALFTEKRYQESKNSFSQALAVKPNETYPKQKISEIDRIVADQNAIDRRYNTAIASADQYFINEKYNEAKTTYTKATQIKPNESYPKEKINEINLLIASQQKLSQQYNIIIANADKLFNEKKYNDARTSYTSGLQIKPNEAYPKQKIAEINKLISSQKALNDRYDNAIATANQYFLNEKYNDAKTTYNNALFFKPNEAYPKQKISEIDAILAQRLAAKTTYDKNKKEYDKLIANADIKFNSKDYNNAKALYQQATLVLSDEVYPKQKITEIDNLLAGAAVRESKYKSAIISADNMLAKKSYHEALASYKTATGIKPNEQYPKQKIIEVNKLIDDLRKNKAAYDNFIKLADESFRNNKLEIAKSQYQEALGVKPNEAYPKQRITEVNQLLADNARLLANQEKLEADYKIFIKQGDSNFDQNKFQQAKLGYMRASQLKPNEMYPKNRLSEIDNMLDMLAARQNAYEQKMTQGESMFSSKNYKGALAMYQEASKLKPDELLPKKKISEIQGLINANSKKQANYNGLILQADNLFNKKEYSEAKKYYEQAKFVLPNEEYPKHQIEVISNLIAAAAKRDANLKALVKSYNDKISEADKFFNSKSYNNAMSAYMDAKMIKSDETYPDQQVAKINSIIKNNAAELEANYKKAISNGDQLKSSKSYTEAKAQYNAALSLKPGDVTAKSRIALVNNLIEKDRLDKQKQDKIEADFNKFIAQADGAFKAKSYSSAIAIYKKAQVLKPADKYSKSQIELCNKRIQEQKLLAAQEEERRRQAELAAAKSSFDSKDFDYSGEKRDRNFLNDLAKQYPEGVTIENYDKKNKKIKRVIVNHGGIAKEYIEVKYSYGTYYFRNGQNISRSIFYSETKK